MTTETQTQDSNPFATAEPWGTSTDRYLGVGNHRVKIAEVDGSGTNAQGHPKIELRFENDNGSKRGFEHYSEKFLRKVVELFDCAGLERPKEGEFDPADHCRISKEKLDQLVGREVGIVVRMEKSYKDPTKEFPEIQGYVPADKVEGAAPGTSGSADPLAGSGGQPAAGQSRERPF